MRLQTFAHTAFACRHPGARSLSGRHVEKIARYMRRHSTEWTDLFEDDATTHSEKGRLVLNAANFLENDRIDSQHDYRVRDAAHLVGSWLEELRDSHPQYRRYARSMNIHSLSYYSRAESSSSSAESSSTSESD